MTRLASKVLGYCRSRRLAADEFFDAAEASRDRVRDARRLLASTDAMVANGAPAWPQPAAWRRKLNRGQS